MDTHYMQSALVQDFASGRLCEPVSLRISVATSCDAISSHYSRYFIYNFYLHTIYVMSLSNISIKAHFKQGSK